MANWWDSYVTDTPSYLDPNLTGGASSSSFYDPSQSWNAPSINWWDAVPSYSNFNTAPVQGVNDYSWMYSPQYGDSTVSQNWATPPASSSNGLFGTGITGSQLLSSGLGLAGGLLNSNAAQNAAQTSADAQLQAAQIAANAAKFKPVGVTTNFGTSQFGYDANGNLNSAGYQLSPQLQTQQNALMGIANNNLAQFQGAQAATAPMGQSAQTLFNLGQGYLSTSPQEQAQKYYQDQMALLQPSNERTLAELQNTLQQQGRMGLATGGTSTMAAANPALEAYYNSLLQQQNQLAANATQGGMDYAKFGAGIVGTGGDLLKSMFNTQNNAFQPYQTAFGGAQTIEGLGQNALDQGINIGAKGTASNAQSGALLAQGLTNAANTMQPANAYSPWAGLLSGAGNALQNYQTQANPVKFDPYTGKALT